MSCDDCSVIHYGESCDDYVTLPVRKYKDFKEMEWGGVFAECMPRMVNGKPVRFPSLKAYYDWSGKVHEHNACHNYISQELRAFDDVFRALKHPLGGTFQRRFLDLTRDHFKISDYLKVRECSFQQSYDQMEKIYTRLRKEFLEYRVFYEHLIKKRSELK